jgi:thiamine kinase-like enzyme
MPKDIKIKKIGQYLRNLSPSIIDVRDTDSVDILNLIQGAYNLNYHIRMGRKEFIFRINIDQQSGLSNQIEYEYNALKLLEGFDVSPKAYYMDDKKEFFKFGILIEEYLWGPHLSFEKIDVKEVAELLGRLHSFGPLSTGLMIWSDPLLDTYRLARNDLIFYEERRTSKNKIVALAKKLLVRVEDSLGTYRAYYKPETLNHTDVVFDNFIKTPAGLRLIDWEKPRVDDFTYDLCCFLSEAAQLWCSEKVLNPSYREAFLHAYARSRKHDLDLLREKIKIREPMVSLHWILWGGP